MALGKKKRIGKQTVLAKVVRKTPSGRKRRKSDGTQPPQVQTGASAQAGS